MSFETFLESLDYVPPELERNFTLIRDLDSKVEETMQSINKCVARYEKSIKASDRVLIRAETSQLFDRLKSLSDDKVALAEQTYALIDKNIVKLLSLIQARMIQNQDGGIDHLPNNIGLEMPLDPNEPVYCCCGSVSYGEMVACDNRECPIEWYHLPCVGLTKAPKGRWYCFRCSDIKKQNNKRRKGRANR